MKLKRITALILFIFMAAGLLAGCQAASGDAALPDSFNKAVEAGIAWDELASKADSPLTVEDGVKLMENALTVLGKADANEYLLSFAKQHGSNTKLQRYELAQLLYGVYQDVIADHSFTLSASAVKYEVGGAYKEMYIWDCPDYQQIQELCDTEACNYAIRAYNLENGDKLMKLYEEDWTFRPTEPVTVSDAVETVLNFSRSFEKDPVYFDVTDDAAAKHTIDPALYTGETTLPDATNQDLPNWKGCNISFSSMFAWALSNNPDDTIAEGNFDYLKDLGVNFVHMYVAWSYLQGPDHTFDSKVNLSRLEQLDDIISWCMERDIHMQLVFNDVPNLDFNNQEDGEWFNRCNAVFHDEAVRDTVTEFWRMLAKRYADIPNNYLSFNLMNECDPVDDANYVWGLGDAVAAIREATPHRVIVADVHTGSQEVTGATMAELGCALSYHYYNLDGISVVTPEKEAAEPGFYENLKGTNCLANAHIYGPNYWDKNLPDEAKGALKFSGAVGGAELSVTISEIYWFDTAMKISAAGQTLYQGMEDYTYDEARDYIGVEKTVTVTIPEGADGFEISCPEGSGFTIEDISLTFPDGTETSMSMLKDWWKGTMLAEITVNEDGSCVSTLGLEHLEQNGQTLLDLIAVGEKYGVDVMVGECGFFEGGDPMAAGMRQEVVEVMFRNQIDTFEKYGLAWCFEYIGRYALATPAPYLEGIEYLDLPNSPYYVNLEMDAFFREIMSR
ncbi:MAG: cellulase family glycosylhydrolase [Clostridia bacterium]|nr:cellulase family glycosylhydrolase [Clostridia bacterium]